MRIRDSFAKNSDTWCGLNHPQIQEEEADAVVFGIPYDKGVSYRSGASEGPSVLRQNTLTSTPYTERLESFESLKVFDGGDFQIQDGEDRDVLFSQVEEYVTRLVKAGVFFTMIGGDHSVTIPVEAGVSKGLSEPFGIIHIDAHPDLCDEMGGDRLSHGCVQRRALELDNVQGTESLYFIGIRSIEPDEHQLRKEHRFHIKTAYDCYREGIESVAKDVVEKMKPFQKVYLSLDIDALDPAYAAGTGTPQFGGLTSRQLLTLLETLFDQLPIIAMDVVEVAPPLDPSLTSMYAARKLITEAWGFLARKKGKLETL